MEETKLNQMAKYYDEWWENSRDPRGVVFSKLNALVNVRIPKCVNDKKALDLGSGCGTIIDYLLNKGYNVTGVEYGVEAVNRLKKRFNMAKIIQDDINCWNPGTERYDLVTMIELTQNFSPVELGILLSKVRKIANRVIITCPNSNSLQGRWVTWRKFKAPFVYLYSPEQFEKIVLDSGFKIIHQEGIGFLMPITLLSDFRIQLIPNWLVKFVNNFMDHIAPRLCSLDYLELE